MRPSPLIRPLVLVGLVAALARCGGASLTGADDKKADKKDVEAEDTKGDKPQDVAGAFLNDCEYIAAATLALAETAPIGCTVLDKSGKALDGETFSFALKLYSDDDKESAMTAAEQPNGNKYHMTAELPDTHKTAGYLAMSVTDKNGKTKLLKTATKDIRAAGTKGPPLGDESEGAAKPTPPSGVTPAPGPTPPSGVTFSIKSLARTKSSAAGYEVDMMQAANMCTTGNPIDLPGLTTRNPAALEDGGDFCFRDFQPYRSGPIPLPDGGRRRVYQGSGCTFVLVKEGSDLYWYMTKDASVADLEKYTAAKLCK